MKKLKLFIEGVKKEIKRIRWPKKKELIKFGTVALVFIFAFAIFFSASDVIIAVLKELKR